MAALERGELERAWDEFLERYRRLLFATIRHYVQGYDEVMDVFAQVCDALHADGLARLRVYDPHAPEGAKFSTWLVAVVRNLVMDWFRQRDGRRRLSVLVERLPARQREIFEDIAHRGRTHVEAYELLRSRGGELTYGEFCRELAALYRALSTGRKGQLPRELIGPVELEETDAAGASDRAVESEREEKLRCALAGLEPADRVAVRLYVIEGLPAEEVARLAGWPTPKTVCNRVYRSLAALRETLVQQGIGQGDL